MIDATLATVQAAVVSERPDGISRVVRGLFRLLRLGACATAVLQAFSLGVAACIAGVLEPEEYVSSTERLLWLGLAGGLTAGCFGLFGPGVHRFRRIVLTALFVLSASEAVAWALFERGFATSAVFVVCVAGIAALELGALASRAGGRAAAALAVPSIVCLVLLVSNTITFIRS